MPIVLFLGPFSSYICIYMYISIIFYFYVLLCLGPIFTHEPWVSQSTSWAILLSRTAFSTGRPKGVIYEKQNSYPIPSYICEGLQASCPPPSTSQCFACFWVALFLVCCRFCLVLVLCGFHVFCMFVLVVFGLHTAK